MGFQKLKNDKKGVVIKNALFAIVAVSVVIIAVGVIVGEWGTYYGTGLTSDLEDYNKLNDMSGEARSQKNQITPQDATPGNDNFEGTTFKGAYGIIGKIFSSFNFAFNMLNSLEKRLGLPTWVIESVLTLMFFSVIMTLIAIIFRLGRPA